MNSIRKNCINGLTLEEIDKVLQFTKAKRRIAFDIQIENNLCHVWDIPGYEHENGKWNGTPTTWWLEMEDGDLIPYVDKGVNRVCWEINYKQTNSIKYKWDDYSIRSGGTCSIKANGKEVYQFFARNPEYAFPKAQTLMVQLSEHPYDFINPEKEEGRKIWYYGLPATISPSKFNPGEISVIPEYNKEIDKDTWWDLYVERKNPVGKNRDSEDLRMDIESVEEWKSYGRIGHGDPLWDGMINWFRDE